VIASGSAAAEQRRRRQAADGADREHGCALVRLERERLPHSDEQQHREEAEQVVRGPAERKSDDARRHSECADEADGQAQPPVEGEEARTVHRVWPRMPGLAAALVLRLYLCRSCDRGVMLAVLRNGDQACGPVRGHEQRLGARPQHAVASL